MTRGLIPSVTPGPLPLPYRIGIRYGAPSATMYLPEKPCTLVIHWLFSRCLTAAGYCGYGDEYSAPTAGLILIAEAPKLRATVLVVAVERSWRSAATSVRWPRTLLHSHSTFAKEHFTDRSNGGYLI